MFIYKTTESTIGARLKQLRTCHGLTHDDIARYCKLSDEIKVVQSSMCSWENDKRIPSCTSIAPVADLFAVSVDWILGRANYPYSSNILKSLETRLPFETDMFPEQLLQYIPEDYLNFIESKDLRDRYNNKYKVAVRADILFLLYVIVYDWNLLINTAVQIPEISNEQRNIFLWESEMNNSKSSIAIRVKQLQTIFAQEKPSPLFEINA